MHVPKKLQQTAITLASLFAWALKASIISSSLQAADCSWARMASQTY